MNTARVQAQIEKPLKDQGEQILKELGISTAELIRMTFRQLVKNKALPFEKTPNTETIEAFKEAKDPKKTTTYNNAKEALADMWGEI